MRTRSGISSSISVGTFRACVESKRLASQAVKAAALSSLARAIEAELAGATRIKRPADASRAALRAVGTGYLKFALAEPGLFRTAFSVPDTVVDDFDDFGIDAVYYQGSSETLFLLQGKLKASETFSSTASESSPEAGESDSAESWRTHADLAGPPGDGVRD